MKFSVVEFWVKAHRLPLGKLHKHYATELAVKLGRLVDIDCVGEGMDLGRSFL